MPPCLTLSIIRYGSRVKWSNPGKGVAPSPTPWCSKLSKREPSGHPRLWSPTLLFISTLNGLFETKVDSCAKKYFLIAFFYQLFIFKNMKIFKRKSVWGLKIPLHTTVYWTIFFFMMFYVKLKIYWNPLSYIFLLVFEMHHFNKKSKHGTILSAISVPDLYYLISESINRISIEGFDIFSKY